MREAINRIRLRLYLPEVTAVRSLTDPLGDYPPERRMGCSHQMLGNAAFSRIIV